jgi:hypothetical protein
MKIRSVRFNNRKHSFEVGTWRERQHLSFPYRPLLDTEPDLPIILSLKEDLNVSAPNV